MIYVGMYVCVYIYIYIYYTALYTIYYNIMIYYTNEGPSGTASSRRSRASPCGLI